MKKYLRRMLSAIALVLTCALFVACSNEVKVEKVSVIPNTVPNSILTTEIDQKIADITLRVTMSDGTTQEVKVTKDMINADDYAKLSTEGAKTHVVKVTYEGITVTMNITITEPIQEIEGDKVTYTMELVENNLKDIDALPAEYEIFGWVWGGEPENIFVPCKDGSVTVPTGSTNFLFVFFTKGTQSPDWESPDKLGQSTDLFIRDGIITDELPEIGDTYDFTVDTTTFADNLANGATMPEEYVTYAWTWGGAAGSGLWVPVDATGKFNAASDITNALFAFFPVDVEKADWDLALAQTNNYVVAWDANGSAYVVRYADTTVDLTTIETSLKGGATMPEEYDLHAWVWGGSAENGVWMSVDATGKFSAPAGATNCLFVLMPKGEKPSWDGKLAQTENYDIAEGVATPTPAA